MDYQQFHENSSSSHGTLLAVLLKVALTESKT